MIQSAYGEGAPKAANFVGQPKEGCRADRERSQREGRANQGGDEAQTKARRLLEAIAFLRLHFADEYLGDNVTPDEAAEIIEIVVRLLFGLRLTRRRSFELSRLKSVNKRFINEGVEFLPQLDNLSGDVREALLAN